MHFHVVTLFPDSIRTYANESIIGRALSTGKISLSLYNPRDFTKDRHRRVDQRPYGGGPGMVLQALPVLKAIEKARGRKKKMKVLFFSPSGKQFTNAYAKTLAKRHKDVLLIAGHYEGVDARVKKITKAEGISIGPYILTGGEIPAMVIVDAMSRFIPGVLGNEVSREEDRVSSPEVYTRPEVLLWKGKHYSVPKVLLSGNHRKIEEWKKKRKT